MPLKGSYRLHVFAPYEHGHFLPWVGLQLPHAPPWRLDLGVLQSIHARFVDALISASSSESVGKNVPAHENAGELMQRYFDQSDRQDVLDSLNFRVFQGQLLMESSGLNYSLEDIRKNLRATLYLPLRPVRMRLLIFAERCLIRMNCIEQSGSFF